MKDVKYEFEVNGVKYPLMFNLNVMEAIQEEYGTFTKWGELTSKGEPNAKAVKFGFTQMINEAIDIENDKNGTNRPFMTEKAVGRLLTEYGIAQSAVTLQKAVIDATKSDNEKNV